MELEGPPGIAYWQYGILQADKRAARSHKWKTSSEQSEASRSLGYSYESDDLEDINDRARVKS